MNQLFNFKQPLPLSLYVHLPWCIRKCPYCDFNSHQSSESGIDEIRYVDALMRDLDVSFPYIEDRKIISIFIGGGTPSLFSAGQLRRLLTFIDSKFELTADVEITLEANPGASDCGHFAGYREAGVNRLSIGVQSFDDRMLKSLGRIHDADQAIQAVNHAKSAGFDVVNVDIMYGLPGQNLEQAMHDLSIGINQDVMHISWYQLTLEPNTVFHKYPPLLPSEDKIWDIQRSGQSLITASGFENYEISAYAREGNYCRHNMNYWQFGDYLGIGAGAHSKITSHSDKNITRYTRHRGPEQYMQLAGSDSVITGCRQLTDRDTVLEFMMNSLRLRNGIDTDVFNAHSGLPLSFISQQLQFAQQRGWLNVHDNKIMPTENGQNYLNDLLQCFMPDSSPA